MLLTGISCSAQQPDGPQSDAPPAVAAKPVPAPQAGSSERITIPSGTRVGVVLENGISTRSAKPGDSIYLQTSFPITQNNRIVIPVGSYLRGELLESKRPGKVKGKRRIPAAPRYVDSAERLHRQFECRPAQR